MYWLECGRMCDAFSSYDVKGASCLSIMPNLKTPLFSQSLSDRTLQSWEKKKHKEYFYQIVWKMSNLRC